MQMGLSVQPSEEKKMKQISMFTRFTFRLHPQKELYFAELPAIPGAWCKMQRCPIHLGLSLGQLHLYSPSMIH